MALGFQAWNIQQSLDFEGNFIPERSQLGFNRCLQLTEGKLLLLRLEDFLQLHQGVVLDINGQRV